MLPDISIIAGSGALGAFGLALFATLILVLTKHLHGSLSMDGNQGVQKVHTHPTPRIGGVAIFLALALSLIFVAEGTRAILTPIVLAGLPAFLAGFAEDLTKAVSPARRLLATMISGMIFAVAYGQAWALADMQWVSHIWEPDLLIYGVAILLLTVGMAGVANAVNIVDGYHGLAPGGLIIMFLAFAVITHSVGDTDLALASIVLAAVMGGFFVINWPLGKIFLGDAGAYFAGFALAAVAVFATARNAEISPFVSLLVILYPVYETLFSIRRKLKREGHSPSQPDRVHMHMLVSRSFARPIASGLGYPHLRNALSGVMMWPFPAVCAILAVASQGSGRMAALGCLIFILLYGRIYAIISLRRKPVLNEIEGAVRRMKAQGVAR